MNGGIINRDTISGGVIEKKRTIVGGVVEPTKQIEGGVISRNQGGGNDYNPLRNHPQINGEELIGNKTSDDLHIKQEYTYSEVGAVGAENQIAMEEIDRLFNAVFGVGLG